jgi:hypothetical protein
MKWFLVRLHKGTAEGFPTREQAKAMRDRLVRFSPKGGFNKDTIEVIPTAAIREIVTEWDRMIKTNEFAESIGDRPALSIGEVAVMRSMRQDLLERLDSL